MDTSLPRPRVFLNEWLDAERLADLNSLDNNTCSHFAVAFLVAVAK